MTKSRTQTKKPQASTSPSNEKEKSAPGPLIKDPSRIPLPGESSGWGNQDTAHAAAIERAGEQALEILAAFPVTPDESPIARVAEDFIFAGELAPPPMYYLPCKSFGEAFATPVYRMRRFFTDVELFWRNNLSQARFDVPFQEALATLAMQHPVISENFRQELMALGTEIDKLVGVIDETVDDAESDAISKYGLGGQAWNDCGTGIYPRLPDPLKKLLDRYDDMRQRLLVFGRRLAVAARESATKSILADAPPTAKTAGQAGKESRGRPRAPLEESRLAKRLYIRKMELGRKHRDRLISEYTLDVTEHLSKRARGRQKDQYTSEEVWNEIARLCELARGRHRRLNKK